MMRARAASGSQAAEAKMLLLLLLLLLLSGDVEAAPSGEDDFGARVAFGWALFNERRYKAAAASFEAVLPPPPWTVPSGSSAQAQQQVADGRLGLARALTKLGRWQDSLDQLGAIAAAAAQLSRSQQLKVKASVAAERGAVLACAGRLQEAIDTKQDALLALDEIILATAGANDADTEARATERRFAAECAELSRIMLWAGQPVEAAEVASMAVESGPWSDPLQLPAGKFVPGLAAAPWHDGQTADGKRRLRKSSNSLRPAIGILEAPGNRSTVH